MNTEISVSSSIPILPNPCTAYTPRVRAGKYGHWQSLLEAWLDNLWLWGYSSSYLPYPEQTDLLNINKRWKRKISNLKQEISEIAKQKLQHNEDLRKKSSKFYKLDAGQKAVLLFNPEKIEERKEKFGENEEVVQRFYYTIQDPNNPGYEQEWSVSKRTSQQIDALLMEGYTLLKVERKNSGMQTSYIITPA